MEEKQQVITGDKINAKETLLRFVEVCPQIIKPGIGLEAFVEDFIKASKKYVEYARPWNPEN